MYFRHSLNIINLPTRPLPSWNGWILFKLHMKIQNIFKSLFFFSIVLCQQFLHSICNFFRKCCRHTANFIWSFSCNHLQQTNPFVESLVPDFKIRCSSLINFSDSVDFALSIIISIQRKWLAVSITSSTFNDFIFHADGICLKNISCLIVSQPAAFHMIGIIG